MPWGSHYEPTSTNKSNVISNAWAVRRKPLRPRPAPGARPSTRLTAHFPSLCSFLSIILHQNLRNQAATAVGGGGQNGGAMLGGFLTNVGYTYIGSATWRSLLNGYSFLNSRCARASPSPNKATSPTAGSSALTLRALAPPRSNYFSTASTLLYGNEDTDMVRAPPPATLGMCVVSAWNMSTG